MYNVLFYLLKRFKEKYTFSNIYFLYGLCFVKLCLYLIFKLLKRMHILTLPWAQFYIVTPLFYSSCYAFVQFVLCISVCMLPKHLQAFDELLMQNK